MGSAWVTFLVPVTKMEERFVWAHNLGDVDHCRREGMEAEHACCAAERADGPALHIPEGQQTERTQTRD